MTTQYTSILKLALPVTGELSGTWGDIVNDNITSMIEQAIAGLATVNTWSANAHTLTTANGISSESRCAMLVLTDTGVALTGAATVVCPTATKIYIVKNTCGQAATITTAAGTGVTIPNGETSFVFCDGTNVVQAVTRIQGADLDFTKLKGTGAVVVTNILDEDDMASDSATALATQQSIKAYVDAQISANNDLAEILANGNTTGGNNIAVSAGDDITFTDTSKAIFGTGGDLQVYHDGSNAYAVNATGSLIVDTAGLTVQNAAGTETMLTATENGAVSLYYDNAARVATTSAGVDITGGINATGAARLGVLNTDTSLTTYGTGSLTLSTNEGTNSGTISIAQGLNGNITLTPNGTGYVSVPTMLVSGGTANGVAYLNGSKVLTSGSALTFDGTNLGVNGSVKIPQGYALEGRNQANSGTGVWFGVAGRVDFGVGGDYAIIGSTAGTIWGNSATNSEQMRLTSTGLGIGTSSPASAYSGAARVAMVAATGSNAASLRVSSANASAELYSAGSATDWGLYSASNSPFAIYTNSVRQLVIDASGNLGLGVTPSAWASAYKAFDLQTGGLAIAGGVESGVVTTNAYWDFGWKYKTTGTYKTSKYEQFDGTHTWYTAPSGTAGNAISFSQAMTLDASGRLLVGITSGSYALDVGDVSGGNMFRFTRSGVELSGFISGGVPFIGSTTNNAVALMTNSTERARIDSSGNLLVGKTASSGGTAGIELAPAGQVISTRSGGSAGYFNRLTSDGSLISMNRSNSEVGSISVTTTATSYNTTSDYRLKENVTTLTGAADRVKALKPSRFNFIADPTKTVDGFIAHEAQAVVPEAVTGKKDAVDADGNPVYQGIDQSKLVPLLTAALQEALARVESLESRLTAAGL